MSTFQVLLLLLLAPMSMFCCLYLIVGWEIYVQGRVFPFMPTYPRQQPQPGHPYSQAPQPQAVPPSPQPVSPSPAPQTLGIDLHK